MQYSDTTNKTGLVEDAAFWCGSTNGSLPEGYNANDVKRNIREWYRKALAWYLESASSWKINDTTATTNLVAGTRSYQLSLVGGLAMSFLRIERVEVAYDGSSFYRAEPLDRSTISKALSDTSLDNDFDQSNPRYVLREDYIDLYPKPAANASNSLVIYYTLDIGTFGAGATDVPVLPPVGQRIISKGAAFDYLASRDFAKADKIMQLILMDKIDLQKSAASRNEDLELTAVAKSKDYK